MFSSAAACFAFERSREAIAVISHHGLRCIAGMTFLSAMFAVLKIPQRTLIMVEEFHAKAQRSKGRLLCTFAPLREINLEGVKDGTDLESLFELLERQRRARMEQYSHFATGREIEKVVGEEAVVFRNREINSLREFVRRNFDAEAVACAGYLRRDSWLRELQLLERREKVLVTRNHFPIHHQLTIDKHILAVSSVKKLLHLQIDIRATR